MKIQARYALPAMLMLAGCATTNSVSTASNAPAPAVAAPQRVDAVSDAVGARIDTMLAGPSTSHAVTR